MRFSLRLCACVLVLSVHVWASAASNGTAPDAPGPCALSPVGAFGDEHWPDTGAVVVDDGEKLAPERDVPEPDLAETAMVNIASFSPARAPLLEEAYADALEVLKEDEECSAFFGGRAAASHVLRRLVGQLRDESIKDSTIGIRMQGTYSTVVDMRTGARFRLFESAAVNRNGPFFRASSGRTVFNDCGSFPANTRGARAAMLLHELGHLMRGADNNWLLPNDGGDAELVARNTARIEKSCGNSLKTLGALVAPADKGLTARVRR